MNFEQKHTTETQRTQRLHREVSEPGLFEAKPDKDRAKMAAGLVDTRRLLLLWLAHLGIPRHLMDSIV
jgi:hypothetical protein